MSIDTSALATIPDPDAVSGAMSDFVTFSQGLSDTMTDSRNAWYALQGAVVFDGDDGLVDALQEPAGDIGLAHMDVETISGAVDTFVAELRDLKSRADHEQSKADGINAEPDYDEASLQHSSKTWRSLEVMWAIDAIMSDLATASDTLAGVIEGMGTRTSAAASSADAHPGMIADALGYLATLSSSTASDGAKLAAYAALIEMIPQHVGCDVRGVHRGRTGTVVLHRAAVRSRP